jgi:anionic cell wall polymer biosynthesis LytR-Cps2A-Psr (LCP) family protein
VDAPLVDPWSGINLPEAGFHTLEGYEALAFLRTRKGVGDGSDLSRISSQQVYMAALVRTLQADGVLNDVGKLYGLAQVAANTMVLSTSLGSLDVMVAMARALRGIPNENIVFIQYPVVNADPELYPGRVVPDEALAATVGELLRSDEAFTLQAGSEGYGSTSGDAGVEPEDVSETSDVLEGLVGQTAGDETCTVAR